MSQELVNSGDPVDEVFPQGPEVGDIIPEFGLLDQNGTLFNYRHNGRKRALILFHRSASW
ncbi:MAG: hypothetical protein HOH43_05445 [Candidatus Latescibacteria bacterium]|jgi:hypothetical protein|nr:hypothetical protein [Candidatus Latescibacterota bacterium]